MALLPVILHLRSRAKEKWVDFPGAFFSDDPSPLATVSRKRIEDVLLLCLRCLLFLAVIGALAEPQLKGWGRVFTISGTADVFEGSEEAVVLVIDDSPSLLMRTHSDRGQSLRYVLKKVARHLKQFRGRRRIAVETTSGRGLSFMNPGPEFEKALKELLAQPVGVSGGRTKALLRAHGLLKDAIEARKIILFFTEFCVNDEDGSKTRQRAQWSNVLKLFRASRADAPTLLIFDLNQKITSQWLIESLGMASTGNTQIGSVQGLLPMVGQQERLSIRIRCVRGGGRRKVRVEWAQVYRNGKGVFRKGVRHRLRSKEIILKDGEAAEFSIPLVSTQAGPRWYRAEFEDADALPFDDHMEAVISFREKQKVVLWDKRTPTSKISVQEDRIRQIMQSAAHPMEGSDASRIRFSHSGLPNLDSLATGSVLIVLHDPSGSGLALEEAGRLRALVEAGLHVLWVPDLSRDVVQGAGDVFHSEPFMRSLFARKVQQVEFCSAENAPWQLRIVAQEHPLMKPFLSGRNGGLTQVGFKRRLRLSHEPFHRAGGGLNSEKAKDDVLASFADGRPAVVGRRLGLGAVYQLAFGLEASGGLAASPAWPIFLSVFFDWASRDGMEATPRLLAPHSTQSIYFRLNPLPAERIFILDGPLESGNIADRPKSFARSGAASGSSIFSEGQGHGGWRMHVPENAEQVSVVSLKRTGLYRLRDTRQKTARWLNNRIANIESELKLMPKAIILQIKEAAKQSGGRTIRDVKSLPDAWVALQPGQSVAAWCWILFAVAMILELGILGWRRRSG